MPKKVKKSARKKAVRKVKKAVKKPREKSVKKAVKKPAKKAVKRAAKPKTAQKAAAKTKTGAGTKSKAIGKVTHYYDKIGVAVVKLSAPLAVGEEIRISGHGREFTQAVDSMQVDHKAVGRAGKGQELGLKVTKEAKEGDAIFRA